MSKCKVHKSRKIKKRHLEDAQDIFDRIAVHAPVGITTLILSTRDMIGSKNLASVVLVKFDDGITLTPLFEYGDNSTGEFVRELAKTYSRQKKKGTLHTLIAGYSFKEPGWTLTEEALEAHEVVPSSGGEHWEVDALIVEANENISISWGELELEPGSDLYVDEESDYLDSAVYAIMDGAADGTHVITAGDNVTFVVLEFTIQGEAILFSENKLIQFLDFVSTLSEEVGEVSLTVITYLSDKGKEGPVEMRAWRVGLDKITAITGLELQRGFETAPDTVTWKTDAQALAISFEDAWEVDLSELEITAS